MEDSELVRVFQGGDESAFDELVSRHRRQAYGLARSMLRSHEQADEVAQDAFLKAYQGLANFKGGSTFKTWLYRITVNTALDLRAREATQRRVRAAARQERGDGPPADPRPRPLDVLMREQELVRLREAMARLPERQRLTLSLRVQQDLKYSEIAAVLGCPVGTVKANHHHAVRNLRRYLSEAEAAEPQDGRLSRAVAAGDE